MVRKLSVLLVVSLGFLLAPLASAAIIVSTSASTSSSSSNDPDTYVLDDAGQFEGFFFSPFDVGDLAWSDGSLFVGHEDSGTIARIDDRGGLEGLIETPVNRIEGLAIDGSGQFFAAEGSSNRLFKLDTGGNLLDIRFLDSAVTALAITPADELVFAMRQGTSSFSPLDIVFYDFEDGAQSQFSSNLSNIFGLTVLGDELLVVGASSSSFSAPTLINRFSFDGQLLGTLSGPQSMRSITSHAPEPGTAVLLGIGLVGLHAQRSRRPALR